MSLHHDGPLAAASRRGRGSCCRSSSPTTTCWSGSSRSAASPGARCARRTSATGSTSGSPGRGVMPTAVALAADHCFTALGLHRIEVNIRPENAASLRVVEKLGFREEGTRAALPAHRRRVARPPVVRADGRGGAGRSAAPLARVPAPLTRRHTSHTSHRTDPATHRRRSAVRTLGRAYRSGRGQRDHLCGAHRAVGCLLHPALAQAARRALGVALGGEVRPRDADPVPSRAHPRPAVRRDAAAPRGAAQQPARPQPGAGPALGTGPPPRRRRRDPAPADPGRPAPDHAGRRRADPADAGARGGRRSLLLVVTVADLVHLPAAGPPQPRGRPHPQGRPEERRGRG